MKQFRYRTGLLGKVILQVFVPEYRPDPDGYGTWRDADLKDISHGVLAPIKPHQAEKPELSEVKK